MRLRFNVLSIDFVHVTNCFYDYYDYGMSIHKEEENNYYFALRAYPFGWGYG